ncbi:CPXCG motif-containing cysteine-rich protein [Amphritea sp. 2_MG-2023]|uniref:CPXCG motif-containing cysteine-rich protein n=1 Tax=Amphritea TaxID=515417 RepID=UPI001C076190|nr:MULTISPECIES: CPXCG motif-containing cysteine-rich protein [Amphritea]MBU2966616.1 CPXCG motif-containing cysteine-rich protein [Amphritea atlantica]MDO6417525.1 CPXCG motif-containing cysteine-rich protein [Amphritea sp. 2_MG-2023]MDX2421840.1 CPXCG motif-containing cysteine-rich protein [Amphritea sp.]
MQSIETVSQSCPYCGEPIVLLVDCSAGDQQYIEDCQVCCKPITVELRLEGSEAEVCLKTENEV